MMEATAKKSNTPAQADPKEKIFMERNDHEVKKERDRYSLLFESLKRIAPEFEKIGIGPIKSLDEILFAINEGGIKLIENILEELIKKEPEKYPGLMNFKKEKLPELFNMNSPEQFYSVVINAIMLSKGLSFEFFTFKNGEVNLNEENLQKALNEKWSWYLTDPNDIKAYHRRKAFAEACNIMFREEGLSLINLHFFIENTGGTGSNYKPKFSFTRPW